MTKWRVGIGLLWLKSLGCRMIAWPRAPHCPDGPRRPRRRKRAAASVLGLRF